MVAATTGHFDQANATVDHILVKNCALDGISLPAETTHALSEHSNYLASSSDFVDYNNRDLRLVETSGAIEFAPEDVQAAGDFLQGVRKQGSAVDAGAYEHRRVPTHFIIQF